MEALNEYLYLILACVGLIGTFVEMRVKVGTILRRVDDINGKVQRHESWIQKAKGRWGDHP